MKFCYMDESGTGSEPVVVSTGIVVDAIRMHKTKQNWNVLLSDLSNRTGTQISELHMNQLYGGRADWGGVDGPQRAQIVTGILLWLLDRKHLVTFSAIDKAKFDAEKASSPICQDLGSSWAAASFHVVLSVQKANQRLRNNKGHTVLVLDRITKEENRFSELVYAPPTWSESYYGKSSRQDSLDAIVDVPFFADSKHALLIQVADLIAFILRRYSEIIDYGDAERYEGERGLISSWANQISQFCYPESTRYLKRGRCQTAELFYQLAPASLRRFCPPSMNQL